MWFPLLTRLSALQQASDTHSSAFLELQQSLPTAYCTLFEVSSVTAELVCERDRAHQVADRMDEVDASLVKRLTLASIVIGGVAAAVGHLPRAVGIPPACPKASAGAERTGLTIRRSETALPRGGCYKGNDRGPAAPSARRVRRSPRPVPCPVRESDQLLEWS